jgi:hypothetical protein
MTAIDDAATAAHKPSKRRSPNFPFIGLEESLALAEKIYKAEGTGFAPVHVVVTKHWGYGIKSSAWKVRLAALMAFGLLDSKGEGDTKAIRISERAKAILLDRVPNSPARRTALREAALSPTVYKDIRDKWSSQLGSDATVETYLVMERDFTDVAAKAVLEQYKATIAFAKVNEPANLDAPGDLPESSEAREHRPHKPKKHVARGANMHDYPVTLPSLNVATFQVPVPLSELDFAFLKAALEAYKDALTSAPQPLKKEVADADPDEEGHGAD